MSYQRISLGDPLLLRVQTGDAATSKYPLAYVYDSSHSAVVGSPFTLTHIANGLYGNESYTPASADHYDAVYKVFIDAGHLYLDPLYNVVTDSFDVYTPGSGGGGGGTTGSELTVIISSDTLDVVLSADSLEASLSSVAIEAILESSQIDAVLESASLEVSISSDTIGAELSSDSLQAVLESDTLNAELNTDTLTATFTCSP
jgi:hypothetical protein